MTTAGSAVEGGNQLIPCQAVKAREEEGRERDTKRRGGTATAGLNYFIVL